MTAQAYLDMLVPVAAVALDLWLKDPESWPHPVRYVGRWACMVENFLFGLCGLSVWSGTLGLLAVVAPVWLIVDRLTAIPFIGSVFAVYFGFTGLALGQLLLEFDKVRRLVDAGEVQQAREALSGLVTRDVSELDAAGVRRVLAETVSENLSDGFVGPLFYLCVLGPAWMWIYKAVNTLDSMWGYRTARYELFGKAAARTDDVLSFMPAKLTALLMIAMGRIMGRDWQSAWDNLLKDANKLESPNAGWPMAAAAWLVGGAMGGPAIYFGESKDKPWLGPEGKQWTVEALQALRILLYRSALLGAVIFIVYHALLRFGTGR